MPPQAIPVEIPVAEVVASPPRPAPAPSRHEAAAQVLEKAAQASHQDPSVLYMLAMAYKRQGKTNDARTALRKIASPDANVILQMGLLSLTENQLAQAEGEFARAWAMDASSYAICYNLLLTQLTLGKVEPCLELIPRAIELLDQGAGAAASPVEDRRFLQVLYALLKVCRKGEAPGRAEMILAELHPADEQRLLRVVRSLGQLDTVHTLLRTLSEARPRSMPVRESYVEAVLVKGKDLLDRCLWTEAELLLRPLERERGFGRTSQIALLNLLGCCSCMTQDFDGASEVLLRGAEAGAERSPAASEHGVDLRTARRSGAGRSALEPLFRSAERSNAGPRRHPALSRIAGLREPQPAGRPIHREGEVVQRHQLHAARGACPAERAGDARTDVLPPQTGQAPAGRAANAGSVAANPAGRAAVRTVRTGPDRGQGAERHRKAPDGDRPHAQAAPRRRARRGAGDEAWSAT